MRSILLILLSTTLIAQERPLASLPYTPSLEPAFMDRTVNPCVDFFKYSCGNWIRTNPIPPDQSYWTVYAKMTDENQRFLWGILEQLAKPSPRRSANEQKIGDYFGACMDESAVEKLGAAPLRPVLDQIQGMRTLDDLPPLLARLHLGPGDAAPLFGFGSNQDFADSERVIAFASAGGLGLPDRDYYVKTDPKSQEIRARYLEHVAAILQLAGETPAAAKDGAATVMAIETALAKASLTRVELRDPHKMFHKVDRAQFLAMTPSFHWAAYWKALGVAAPPVVNVTEPAFFAEVETELKARSLAE